MSEPRKSRESAPWPPALGVPGYRLSRPPGSTAVALPREGAKQRVTCPVARPGRPPTRYPTTTRLGVPCTDVSPPKTHALGSSMPIYHRLQCFQNLLTIILLVL